MKTLLLPPALQADLEKNYKSRAQMLQHKIKLYVEKFFPDINSKDWYELWKEEKGIQSTRDLNDDEINAEICKFCTALSTNTP